MTGDKVITKKEYELLLPSRKEFFDELFELMYPLEEEKKKVYAEFGICRNEYSVTYK